MLIKVVPQPGVPKETLLPAGKDQVPCYGFMENVHILSLCES
jgi:hypothetical protein